MTTLAEICAHLDGVGTAWQLVGQGATEELRRADVPHNATPESLCWSDGSVDPSTLVAGCVVLERRACDDRWRTAPCRVLLVDGAKSAFAAILREFFEARPSAGVHPSAVIHPDAELAADVAVGPNSTVGRAQVGAGTIIHGNAHIADDVTIGCGCEIHPGVVLGSPGSGYVRDAENRWQRFPQLGGLRIGDHVEIGANSYVCRGTLDDSVIGDWVRIGLSCCIGHNVHVGDRSVILANAVIAGSSEVGPDVYISVSATVRNKLRIGPGATVGMGAVVTRDVEPGSTVFGVPAKAKIGP